VVVPLMGLHCGPQWGPQILGQFDARNQSRFQFPVSSSSSTSSFGAHFQQAKQAMEAKKHVVVDKPLCITAADAQAQALVEIEIAAANGLLLSVEPPLGRRLPHGAPTDRKRHAGRDHSLRGGFRSLPTDAQGLVHCKETAPGGWPPLRSRVLKSSARVLRMVTTSAWSSSTSRSLG
jgi:hypothetical protein